MSEEWRAVPGYEGRYEVSNMGQVRSLTHETVDTCGRRREFPGKVLAATPTAGPYPMINLRKGPSSRAVRVHELVLLAFVGPRPEGLPHIRRHAAMNAELLNTLYRDLTKSAKCQFRNR